MGITLYVLSITYNERTTGKVTLEQLVHCWASC